MAELHSLTIAEAAEQIRLGQLSPVELVDAYLKRIHVRDPLLQSYITVTSDLAIEQARRAADEIARGGYLGPLHGIPISYKDTIETAGVRTTAGSAVYECAPTTATLDRRDSLTD